MKKVISFIILILIFIVRVNAYDNYKAGDILEYNGKEYYVLYDSDGNDNYLTLMYKNYLTQDEIDRFINDTSDSSAYLIKYESSNGELVGLDE